MGVDNTQHVRGFMPAPVLYNASNLHPGATTDDFEPRTTSTRSVVADLARAGAFDMTITVYNTLTRATGFSSLSTSASGDTITKTSHGLPNGRIVIPSAVGTTGLTIGTKYYVLNATTNTFQLSTSSSGTTPVDIAADSTVDLTVGVPLFVRLDAVHKLGSSALANAVGVELFRTSVDGTDVPYDGRLLLAPNPGGVTLVPGYAAYPVEMLAQAVDGIKISWGARQTPEAGGVAINIGRRY